MRKSRYTDMLENKPLDKSRTPKKREYRTKEQIERDVAAGRFLNGEKCRPLGWLK